MKVSSIADERESRRRERLDLEITVSILQVALKSLGAVKGLSGVSRIRRTLRTELRHFRGRLGALL